MQLTVGRGPRSAAPDTARPPAADPLVWILGGLACLYAGLAFVQLAELPGSASRVMAGTAAVSAGCFAGGAGWVAARLRHGRPAPRLVEAYAFVPVVNCLLRLALLEDLRHTSPLTLVIVGLAVAVRSRQVLVAAVISSCAGWVAVVLAARLQGPAALQCALELAVAVALAVLLRGALRRREHQLHAVQHELERTADQFTRIFRDSPVGIGMSDADGHLVAVNPAFCRLVGRPEEDLLGATDLAYTHEDDRGEHAATGPRIEAADDRVAHVEKRYVRPDGGVRRAWLSLTHVEPPAGVRGPLTLAHVQDVTDRHDAEEALRESERTLSAVSGVARQVRSGEDARAVIMEAVHELAAADTVALVEPDPEVPDTLVVTAARGAEVLGTRIPLSTTSRTVQVFRSGLPVFLADPAADALTSPALLALSGARSMMLQPVTTGGTTTAVLAVTWKETVLSAEDRRPRSVAVLADEAALALDHERLIRRLEDLAETDQLTGLTNRRGWDLKLPVLLSQARRSGRPLTVAIADLDRFKRYNDVHGHPAGDRLLRRTARAFAADLRPGDLLARWGGEEFALALPDCAAAEALGALERLRLGMPDEQTCSVGYAVWDGTESLESLVERADAALYDAKQAGRDRVRGEAPALA